MFRAIDSEAIADHFPLKNKNIPRESVSKIRIILLIHKLFSNTLFPPRKSNTLMMIGCIQPLVSIGLFPIIESIVTRNTIGQAKRRNIAAPTARIEKTYNDLLPFIKFQSNFIFFIIFSFG